MILVINGNLKDSLRLWCEKLWSILCVCVCVCVLEQIFTGTPLHRYTLPLQMVAMVISKLSLKLWSIINRGRERERLMPWWDTCAFPVIIGICCIQIVTRRISISKCMLYSFSSGFRDAESQLRNIKHLQVNVRQNSR